MSAIKVHVFERKGSPFWQIRWIDPDSGREVWKSTKTKVYRDAERVAGQTEKELNEGTYYKTSTISWKDFRERYETEEAVGMSKRTQQKIRTVLNYIENHLNPKKLRAVNENALSKLVKKLREQGLEEVTIKTSLGHIRAAMSWAKTQKLIGKVPDFPKLKRVRKKKVSRGRPITLEEFERMIAAIPEVIKPRGKSAASVERHKQAVASWEFFLWGLWWSGLRMSESLELYWDREDGLCLDFSGEFPIMRIRAESEKGFKDRLLPIVPEFAEFLQQVPEDQRTGPVFNPAPGRKLKKRLASKTVSGIVADIGEKAGVIVSEKGNIDKETGERKPRFASAHDFRRAFGFRWSRRVKAFELKELMRHETIATTEEYYLEQNTQDTARSIWDSCKAIQYSKTNSIQERSEKAEETDSINR